MRNIVVFFVLCMSFLAEAVERECLYQSGLHKPVFRGNLYKEKSDDEYANAVEKLPVAERQVLIQAIIDYRLGRLGTFSMSEFLVSGPDQEGRDITLSRVYVKRHSKQIFYHVEQGRGDNSMNTYYEVIGSLKTLKGELPLVSLVARYDDGSLVYCEEWK